MELALVLEYLIGSIPVKTLFVGVKPTKNMHDTEPDTFVYETWPEKVSHMLKEIGLDATPKDLGTDPVEKAKDYYGRNFSQATRMITNRGCVELKNSNIDVIQIIQKG
jgi:hypothetical protein